jgi:ApaG protein
MPTSSPTRISDTITDGIRIAARPFYIPEESDPTRRKHVFGYRIVIHNEGEDAVQLMSRHWIIIDGDGARREVKGEGVIGEQPILEPGQGFQYTSFCPLPTQWGTMEGAYQMRRVHDNSMFDAAIGRFYFTMSARQTATEAAR